MYRHIAASRLHEFSLQEVVLDSDELLHLEICPECAALLQRFVESGRRGLGKEEDKQDDCDQ